MSRGSIKFFNSNKGFGFIKQEDGNEIFFHISEVDGQQELRENDPVEFEIGESRKGPCAVRVKLAPSE